MWHPYSSADHLSGCGRSRTWLRVSSAVHSLALDLIASGIVNGSNDFASKPHSGHTCSSTQVQFLSSGWMAIGPQCTEMDGRRFVKLVPPDEGFVLTWANRVQEWFSGGSQNDARSWSWLSALRR